MTVTEIFEEIERFDAACEREAKARSAEEAREWYVLAEDSLSRLRLAHANCPALFDLAVVDPEDLLAMFDHTMEEAEA
jgi:hypothetical protein